MTAADFSGYATRNDLRCSDGRTILAGAFEENDGQMVPLVWQHGHDNVTNILGHVKLENRPDGVYCHAFFNASAEGQHAKEMVRHGDVKWLSIFANQLVERVRDKTQGLRDVLKGNIREVSLVVGGANPGAEIDNVNIVHSDGSETRFDDEAYITTGLEIELPSAEMSHADTSDNSLEEGGELTHESAAEIIDALDDKSKTAVFYMLSQALVMGSMQHSDTEGGSDADAGTGEDAEGEGEGAAAAEPTDSADESGDSEGGEGEGEGEEAPAETGSESGEGEGEGEEAPAETGSEESAEGSESSEGEGDEPGSEDAADDNDGAGDAVQHGDTNQEDNSMTHNVFDQANPSGEIRHSATLSQDAVKAIVRDAVNGTGSLKKSLENYVMQTGITVDGTLSHGIENIEYLFPDSKTLESSPAFISRRMEWVDKVLSSVRKSPFARIKTITADITPDEARARGYIKGNMKNEEYFALAKRETTPQTIYKKQKLDRDDVIDIVDLDVVAWLKAEMKVMLDEELAGAILVGDGRSTGDDDKIKEINIRPIASDAELYVTTVNVNLLDASSSVEELVDAVIANRQYYKGTGQPTFYTTEGIISKFLTVKDNFGRRIYSNLAEVAAVLRVSDIVPVEVMERVPDLAGIMVNLADYTLGADRGGQATMFDDFDIDYNKLRYLIETRVSGALTQPKSAIVFRTQAGASVLLVDPTMPTFNGTDTVTVPTVTHVVYKDGAGATLTTGSPVDLDPGEKLHVKATAAAGYYFADDVHDEWDFEGVEA